MDEEREVVKHHAILIGIDSYAEKQLTSCVRDVEEMRKYLSKMPFPVDMQVFRAPIAKEPCSSPVIEHSKLWPTGNNVKSSLRDIATRAQPGHFVYIHFSGHGTRIPPSYDPASKYQYTGDVGLILLGEANSNNTLSLVRGLELAYLIKNMVAKGLLVNLVLDCCFSGGMSRHDDDNPENIRYLDYNTVADAAYPLDPKDILDIEAGSSDVRLLSGISRDASMLSNLVINPDGCAILAACGPHEEAGTIQCDEDKQKYGALSYLLRKTLSQLSGLGTTRTLREVHEQLSVQIRLLRPQQNPVLYGNGALQFFGPQVSETVTTNCIAALKMENASPTFKLWLQAGHAHGLCEGDLFIVEPFYLYAAKSSSSGDPATQLRARATSIGPLTSELEVPDHVPSSDTMPSKWIASPLTRFALRHYPIRLSTRFLDLDEWQEASSKRVSLDTHFTDAVERAFLFHVVLDDLGNCEVRDKTNKPVPFLPIAPLDHNRAAEQNLNLVERLVRFKHLEELTNSLPRSDPPLRESFRVRFITSEQKIYDPGNKVIEVRHWNKEEDNCVTLEVHNTGNSTLYIQILNLGPLRQIENIWDRASDVIYPRGPTKSNYSWITSRKIKMTVPDTMIEKGQRQCEDILKIFVTTRPSSFASWEMPGIQKPSTVEQPELEDYQVGRSDEHSEDWETLNFYVRTKMD